MQHYKKVFVLLALGLGAHSSLANHAPISQDGKYNPVIEISATNYRKRPISEMDLMIPMWQNHNNLSIFDIKLKKDRKSFEYNLGLVYRHNFDDRWIFGIYSYFDRRRTGHKLEANQWTFGTEALSRFFDARFNFYLPENKKQTIHVKPRELRRDHTAIYAVSEGKFQEHTLPGYDVEAGTPLFGLFPKIDDKLGTKIYVAKYDFTRKGVAKNSGLRFRLEQKLFEDRLENSPFSLTLHLGTHYTTKKKWDNFVGLSLRVPLSTERSSRTKMQERMMDTIVRDVDIRTERHISQPSEPLFLDGKKIQHVYFVAEKPPGGGCGGDGSSGNPYCLTEYVEKIKGKDANFIIAPIGSFTEKGYKEVMKHPAAIDNITHDVVLATRDRDAAFSIKDHFPELVLVKSPDNQVHTYSAVTAIYEPEQMVPEKQEKESMSLYDSYSQYDACSSAYACKEEVLEVYEAEAKEQGALSQIPEPIIPEKPVLEIQESEQLVQARKPKANGASSKNMSKASKVRSLRNLPIKPPIPVTGRKMEAGYDNQQGASILQGHIRRSDRENVPEQQKPREKSTRRLERLYDDQKGGSIIDNHTNKNPHRLRPLASRGLQIDHRKTFF